MPSTRRPAAVPMVRTLDITGLPADLSQPISEPGQIHVPLSNAGSTDADDIPQLDVPPMRIVMLLVGTAGDIMPFIQLAHMLHERYGHVVRIASHDDLRGHVEKAGLRFYPIKGNAIQMAGWGPSFSLHLPTLLKLVVDPKTSQKLYVIRKVILATIGACTEPDPADPSAEPFHADCIMANPVSLAHVTCAEALGVPLHLFFPNPWVSTVEYPHAFSGWSYPSVPTPDGGFQWTSKAAHAWSYRIIDFVLWHTFLPVFNELRARCQLRTLRLGFAGSTIIRDQRVPFSQMWSPSLCPRPADWPSQVNVAGFFFWDQKAREVDESSAEYAPVCAWLAQGEAPIYIGFGSMVFDGPSTTRIVVEAARRSGKRVLMQTSTAGGTLGVDASELPPNVFAIGRCSHDWLLPKMAAVIHHGGAGTTGAGLRLALPSMCCPFFGDQFFYGHCIAANGCGPYPIAFTEMSVDKLSAAFEAILEPRYADGARRMAARIESENGLEVGLSDFNRQLPLADMVCDVSTLLGERGVGRVYYPALRLKVSDEVDATLRTSVGVDMRLLEGARPHVSKQWHLGSHVRDPCTGLCAGALAFVWELADAIISVVVLPIRAACHNGVAGFLMGILAALLLLVARVVYAPIIAFDRVATGVVNCVCTPKRGERHRPLDHVVDPEPALTRIGQVPRGREPLCGTPLVRCDAGHADGASRWPLHGAVASAEGERRAAIEAAFTRVVALRRAFDALDAGTNDDALSLSEVATLEPAWRPGVVGEPPAPADMPFSADRRPALAEEIGRYMSKHRKSHLQFAEFVLLSREVTPLA